MTKRPTKKRATDPGDQRSHQDVSDAIFFLETKACKVSSLSEAAPGDTVEERVERGAAWLDRNRRGWILLFDNVSIDVQDGLPLSMAFSNGGPEGLYWGWIEGVRALCKPAQVIDDRGAGWKGSDVSILIAHGFLPSLSSVEPDPYLALSRAWHWAILARKEGVA